MFLYRTIPDGGKHGRLCCKKHGKKLCAEAHRSAGTQTIPHIGHNL